MKSTETSGKTPRLVIRRHRRAGSIDREANDQLIWRARARHMRELRRLGYEEVDPVQADPEKVMPEILGYSLGYLRWIRDVVGDLTPEQFWLVDPRTKEKIPGAEFELEIRLMRLTKDLCEAIIRLDLDQRGVQVEEAKLDLLASALQAAAQQVGLDEPTQKQLGAALRDQVAAIESRAVAA